jgi:hypothetical protein
VPCTSLRPTTGTKNDSQAHQRSTQRFAGRLFNYAVSTQNIYCRIHNDNMIMHGEPTAVVQDQIAPAKPRKTPKTTHPYTSHSTTSFNCRGHTAPSWMARDLCSAGRGSLPCPQQPDTALRPYLHAILQLPLPLPLCAAFSPKRGLCYWRP